jgi:hypothetical protein
MGESIRQQYFDGCWYTYVFGLINRSMYRMGLLCLRCDLSLHEVLLGHPAQSPFKQLRYTVVSLQPPCMQTCSSGPTCRSSHNGILHCSNKSSYDNRRRARRASPQLRSNKKAAPFIPFTIYERDENVSCRVQGYHIRIDRDPLGESLPEHFFETFQETWVSPILPGGENQCFAWKRLP